MEYQRDLELLISKLRLEPHPEGGWFRETYRSKEQFESDKTFPQGRSWCTSIYFLLTHRNFSAFHRILSDETWHFYSGAPLEVVEISESGTLQSTLLGSDLEAGQKFQYTVKAGRWFGSRIATQEGYSLTGCTVSPGFDFRDFHLATRAELITEFPHLDEIIKQLTRI